MISGVGLWADQKRDCVDKRCASNQFCPCFKNRLNFMARTEPNRVGSFFKLTETKIQWLKSFGVSVFKVLTLFSLKTRWTFLQNFEKLTSPVILCVRKHSNNKSLKPLLYHKSVLKKCWHQEAYWSLRALPCWVCYLKEILDQERIVDDVGLPTHDVSSSLSLFQHISFNEVFLISNLFKVDFFLYISDLIIMGKMVEKVIWAF